MFSGLAVMILAIPLNMVIANFTKKFQMAQMKAKDERVKLMNEILGGIKILKLYGWEKSFIGQVLGIRSKEILVLKVRNCYHATYVLKLCFGSEK